MTNDEKRICEHIDKNAGYLFMLACKIYDRPETGLNEFYASSLLLFVQTPADISVPVL